MSQTSDQPPLIVSTTSGPTLRLSTVPVWEALNDIHERTLAFLRGHGVDENAVQAVAMVASELCENATKYGTFAGAGDVIEISVAVDSATITVEVSHPVAAAEADNLSRLDGMIQWIRGFQDPFEAYLERLKEVSAQTLEHDESGLGLVRIAYEGRSVLDFFVNERNVLAVSAVHHV